MTAPRSVPVEPRTYPKSKVIKVTDGDTADVLLNLGNGIWQEMSLRIDGINCWDETKSIPESYAAAAAAKEYAAHLLPAGWLASGGPVITVVVLKWDKYGGRQNARIYLPDGRDFGEVMIYAGHAARWDGRGKAPVPPWPIPPREGKRDE